MDSIMKEEFKPQSLSISEVFLNNDPIYQIPDYQRQYSWKDEQVVQLWEDIYGAFLNNKDDNTTDTNYFLGSLIVISKGNSIEDIVDGQQRITTLMILLCVLRRLYPNINKNIDASLNPKVVTIKKIELCISNLNDIYRLRLQADPSNATDFSEQIVKRNTFDDVLRPTKKLIDSETKYRYLNTAIIFNDYLKGLGEQKAGEFINYLMNQVRIIKITCFDESFAIKLFQVLNDRGMDLSPADIIKGYLLAPISSDDFKHKAFMNDWRQIEQWLADLESDDTMTGMFTYYQYYLLATTPKKSLVDELKLQFKERDSNEIMMEFKNLIRIYKDEIFADESKIINSIWTLPWDTHWVTIILAAKYTEYENEDALLISLRRFIYLSYMSGKTLNSVKQTFFNVIAAIKENKDIAVIDEIFNSKIEKEDMIKIVFERLNGEVYYENWLKPILTLVEYYLIDGDEVLFIPIDSNLHAEHILPQNFKNVAAWSDIDKTTGEKYLNTLGNMTLLSGRKNKQAQDYSFVEKIKVYSGKGKNNDKKEGVTSFRISQKIVDDYNANTFNKEWNVDAITTRQKWLIEQICSILDIKR